MMKRTILLVEDDQIDAMDEAYWSFYTSVSGFSDQVPDGETEGQAGQA